MVDLLFENTLEHWANERQWSLTEVLNICWGGLKNLTSDELEHVENMKKLILSAIAEGDVQAKSVGSEVFFNRNDIVKWGSQNLKGFPFEPTDFEKIKIANRPGSNREDTQLKMIGALTLLLMESKGKYKKGSLPNQSQISDAASSLLEHLQEHNPNVAGLKSSNFRATIKSGLELLIPTK